MQIVTICATSVPTESDDINYSLNDNPSFLWHFVSAKMAVIQINCATITIYNCCLKIVNNKYKMAFEIINRM